MHSKLLLVALLGLLCSNSTFGNSYPVVPFKNLPKPESIVKIETELPLAGRVVRLEHKALAVFLNDGRILPVLSLQALADDLPDLSKRINNDWLSRSHEKSEGVLVDKDFVVYRWKLYCPQLLMLADFAGPRVAFIYLGDRPSPVEWPLLELPDKDEN